MSTPLVYAPALKADSHPRGASVGPLRSGMPLACLLAIVTAALVLRPGQHAPQPPRGPADFSLDRARAHLDVIAATTHPVGTAAHEGVQHYLQEQLTALGLQPIVQDALDTRRVRAGVFDVVRVRNVMAKLSGQASTGAVVLVAHYDSALTSPGAADDGAGVAAVLETARALSQGRGRGTTSSCCSPMARRTACAEPRRLSPSIPGRARLARC